MYTASEQRYETMQYRRCGRSGLKLSAVSLGFWHNFGDSANYDNMRSICTTAFDNGITVFDLANCYGPAPGSAEKNFGRIFRECFRPYRDEMIITTKAGVEMWPGPYGNFGSRKSILASLDQSLQRLGLDYVDIFYHHHRDTDTPLEETMEALDAAVKSGKALYVGLSNYDGESLEQAGRILRELHTPFVLVENKYHLLDRRIDNDGSKEAAWKLGVGMTTYKPLAQGLLTDRYINGIPEDSRARTGGNALNSDLINETYLAKAAALRKIAKERGQTLAEMALAWILRDEKVTSVLIGASRPSQILDDVKAIQNTSFTEEELQRIDAVCNG